MDQPYLSVRARRALRSHETPKDTSGAQSASDSAGSVQTDALPTGSERPRTTADVRRFLIEKGRQMREDAFQERVKEAERWEKRRKDSLKTTTSAWREALSKLSSKSGSSASSDVHSLHEPTPAHDPPTSDAGARAQALFRKRFPPSGRPSNEPV